MRAAPPVEAKLDAGRLERMLITLLHALAGVVLAAWSALHAEWRLGGAVVTAGLLAAGLMAGIGQWLARQALSVRPGRLRWDGVSWHLVADQDLVLQRLVVALDLGVWVLLRLHPADGRSPLWRVASAGGAGAAWHGLRVALAAHAGAASPDAGGLAP